MSEQQEQEELNKALIEAAENGHVEECQRLIQAGANVNLVDLNGGWTPLHWAAQHGRLEVCRLLLGRGAVVNATNWFDRTPLHWAAFRGHVEVCRLLIQAGRAGANFDINTIGRDGLTPLHLAADGGHVDACRLLIEQGANVHDTDHDRWTPLHLAADGGHVDVCRLFINRGANVNATDRDGWTPLHQAAWHGHAEVCRLLIERRADVNSVDRNDDRTPLDLAISDHAVEVLVYFYVHCVVNFHLVDHTGRKPWDRLTAQQQEALTRAMAEHQEKIAILQTKGLPIELARLVMGYL